MAETRTNNGRTEYRWHDGNGHDSWHTAPPPAGKGPPAPPSASAPAPPQGPVTNFDPVRDQQLGLNQKTYGDTLSNLDQQTSTLENQFGFNGSGQVDPTNPFSKAALLQRNYSNATRGSTNRYASNGQLYAGSLQNQQNTNAFNYQSGFNTLKTDFNNRLQQIAQARTSAGNNLSQNNLNANAASLGRAVTAPPNL